MPPLDLPQVLPDLPPLTSHPLRENTIVPSVFPRKAEGADAIVAAIITITVISQLHSKCWPARSLPSVIRRSPSRLPADPNLDEGEGSEGDD